MKEKKKEKLKIKMQHDRNYTNFVNYNLYNVWKLYLMSGTANNGGEDGTWRIVSCKASFAHTGSIVNNEGGDFVFHFLGTKRRVWERERGGEEGVR